MKAISIRQFGDPSQFFAEERPVPAPQAGEVLIRVKAASINPIDYRLRQGRFGGDLPLVLGHDAAGIVEQIGEGVTRLQPGEAVWVYLGGPCSNGSYAEYVVVPHEFASTKPRNLSFEEAAAIPVVGLTTNQAIRMKARPTPQHSCFVAGGAGGLGSMAIQILQMIGIERIVCTAGHRESYDFLEKQLSINPDQIVDYRGQTLAQLTKAAIAANGGELFDKVFDFVGGELKRLCFELVEFDGDIVSVVEEHDPFTVPVWHGRASPLFRKSASLHFHLLGARGLFGGKPNWQRYTQDLSELRVLFEAHRLHPVGVQTIGKLSVETIRSAHEWLERGGVQGKLVVSVE